MRRSFACVPLVLLSTACRPDHTELAVELLSSRPVHLETLSLYVALDDLEEGVPFGLTESGRSPTLPGSYLLRLPDNARTASVRVVAVAGGGAARVALDTARILPHDTVALSLRLEFGDETDGGPVTGLQLGEACAVKNDCATGFCVDGVCCDRACDEGACTACAVANGGTSDGVCRPKRAQTVCRPATEACDVDERCDGVATTCPIDAKAAAGTICRPAVGACDIADACDGFATACPPDASTCTAASFCGGATCQPKRAPGAACTGDVQCLSSFCVDGYCCNARCDGGACDRCDQLGKEGSCSLVANGTSCRAATGPCDLEELCSGSSAACPPDQLAPASVACRAAQGACDLPETCTGTSVTCPALDKLVAAGTVCRGKASGCDAEEKCDGVSHACPADVGKPVLFLTALSEMGSEGTVPYTGVIDSSHVGASCDSTATYASFRGYVSFDTSAVPVAAFVLAASVRVCMTANTGVDDVSLYVTSFATPLSESARAAPAVFLRTTPPGSGYQTFGFDPAAIKHGGLTQLEVGQPASNCFGSVSVGRDFASSTSTYGRFPQCPQTVGETLAWTLKVDYCLP